jgi:hypothetical protein
MVAAPAAVVATVSKAAEVAALNLAKTGASIRGAKKILVD